jgi:hypothetical protein
VPSLEYVQVDAGSGAVAVVLAASPSVAVCPEPASVVPVEGLEAPAAV